MTVEGGRQRRPVRANAKMQDVAEFERWYEEGRTYAWMVEEYRRKYGIETTASMFSNTASKLGLAKRTRRDPSRALPWDIASVHLYGTDYEMLRALARELEGMGNAPGNAIRLAAWKQYLDKRGWVVHYEPDSEEGFFYVDARPGIDTEYVRVPAV